MSLMLKALSLVALLAMPLHCCAESTRQHLLHIDMGDFVIVINAEKVVLTGQKTDKKFAHHHSGYPGGMTSIVYADLINQDPTRVIMKAVLGMIPKNKLGRAVGTKLKVYAGSEHPHAAQNPTPYVFNQVSQIVKK
jgi:large subunit ribosomal protein L13